MYQQPRPDLGSNTTNSAVKTTTPTPTTTRAAGPSAVTPQTDTVKVVQSTPSGHGTSTTYVTSPYGASPVSPNAGGFNDAATPAVPTTTRAAGPSGWRPGGAPAPDKDDSGGRVDTSTLAGIVQASGSVGGDSGASIKRPSGTPGTSGANGTTRRTVSSGTVVADAAAPFRLNGDRAIEVAAAASAVKVLGDSGESINRPAGTPGTSGASSTLPAIPATPAIPEVKLDPAGTEAGAFGKDASGKAYVAYDVKSVAVDPKNTKMYGQSQTNVTSRIVGPGTVAAGGGTWQSQGLLKPATVDELNAADIVTSRADGQVGAIAAGVVRDAAAVTNHSPLVNTANPDAVMSKERLLTMAQVNFDINRNAVAFKYDPATNTTMVIDQPDYKPVQTSIVNDQYGSHEVTVAPVGGYVASGGEGIAAHNGTVDSRQFYNADNTYNWTAHNQARAAGYSVD